MLAGGEAAKLLVTRLQNLRDFALAADALGGSAELHERSRPMADATKEREFYR